MTSQQLIRRAQLIETVTELIGESGFESVQMRDVAQRSGVALATAYRYFRSKEQLLGAALEDWQQHLARRILSACRGSEDPKAAVLEYLRRALRAFDRNPQMTSLMLQMMTSTDPDVGSTLEQMNHTNAQMFGSLLKSFPDEEIPNLAFALNATLTGAVNSVLIKRMTLSEAEARVEWTALAILAHVQRRPKGD